MLTKMYITSRGTVLTAITNQGAVKRFEAKLVRECSGGDRILTAINPWIETVKRH